MKNGKAMRGHRRIITPIGKRATTRQPPSGGYNVGCICGWSGRSLPTGQMCRTEYREHLDKVIESTLRTCRRCGQEKSATDFADRWSRHVCKSCYSKMGNEWSHRNPEASARHKRNHHLLHRFGITLAEAEQMLADQDGRCTICREPIKDARGYNPHVDHDHVTGKVRGILCFHCNAGLGQFHDDCALLQAAIEYLRGHP